MQSKNAKIKLIHMAEKNETAEQKLLKMIESSSGAPGASVSAKAQKKSGFDFYSLLRGVNGLLMLGVVAVIVFFANEVTVGLKFMSNNIEIPGLGGSASRSSVKNVELAKVRPLAEYLKALEQRNIFAPYEEVVKTEDGETVVKKSKLTDSLRLVGIAWLDSIESASAMIEDTEKKMTYFLMRGDKIGDLTVKTIYADSVKMGYQGEEIMIKYEKSQM